MNSYLVYWINGAITTSKAYLGTSAAIQPDGSLLITSADSTVAQFRNWDRYEVTAVPAPPQEPAQ